MGIYLDRLHEQHDEITAGVNDVLNRAADENRDVTDDEAGQVERDRSRLAELAVNRPLHGPRARRRAGAGSPRTGRPGGRPDAHHGP
jgi:hypothetical protein